MATLSDHADRLSHIARSILSATENSYSQKSAVAGPFTRAILHTDLGDLIRDIDDSELGLFTLVQPAQPGSAPGPRRDEDVDTAGSSAGELVRAGFAGATPLKKPPKRTGTQRPTEHEPEVYAQAALKYLEQYHPIWPMPRALEQAERIMYDLSELRESIDALNDRLLRVTNSDPSQPSVDPGELARSEECRIKELESEISQLETYKSGKRRTGFRSSNALTPKRSRPGARTHSLPLTTPDAAESSFWNTPAAGTRTLHFTEQSLLTEEHMDLSAPSLVSPLAGSEQNAAEGGRQSHMPAKVKQLVFESKDLRWRDKKPKGGDVETSFTLPDRVSPILKPGHDQENEDEDEPDDTVILERNPSNLTVEKEPVSEGDPEQTYELTEPPIMTAPTSTKIKAKITTELEDIVSKIWVTMGEVIMPGHPFDTTDSGIGTRPPRAKETLACLHQLCLQSPPPGSPAPSVSSATSLGTQSASVSTQQILIAHVLLSLLSSPPTYSMSLNKLKDKLVSKSGGNAGGAVVTRPIYGCVAKRLLKIDRGRGEQVVRFDM